MLRDADPTKFAGIYVVCGFTDMRYDMDHLAAIIESRYHPSLFVPNTLFLFCGKRTSKIKGLVWEGDGFLLLTKRVEEGHSLDHVLPQMPVPFLRISLNG